MLHGRLEHPDLVARVPGDGVTLVDAAEPVCSVDLVAPLRAGGLLVARRPLFAVASLRDGDGIGHVVRGALGDARQPEVAIAELGKRLGQVDQATQEHGLEVMRHMLVGHQIEIIAGLGGFREAHSFARGDGAHVGKQGHAAVGGLPAEAEGDGALLGVQGDNALDHTAEDGSELLAVFFQGADVPVELLTHAIESPLQQTHLGLTLSSDAEPRCGS